jgi:aryl-alcohol dehydrogenase-like predicted oxidoreductase
MTTMPMRLLGTTGLRTSRLGLGLAALGRPGYINLDHATDLGHDYAMESMEAHAHAVLDAALAGGIRYVDAARSYGRAEAFLGSWLHKREAACGEVVVGSKWGYTYTADWRVDAEVHEVKEHSLTVLQRQWQETQTHLGLYLCLYQVHSATLASGIMENLPVLRELAHLHDLGVAIGMTVSGPRQAEVIERALTLELDGWRVFETVQVTWNLLERSTTRILRQTHAAGMGIIVKEALANGLLTAKNDAPGFAKPMAVLRAEAARLATSVDALALAAVLAEPWVDIVLSGAARVEHLRSNLGALAVDWDAQAAEHLAPLSEPPDLYWSRRGELAWN